MKQENREMTCIVEGKSLRRSQDPTFQCYFYSFKSDDNKTDHKVAHFKRFISSP